MTKTYKRLIFVSIFGGVAIAFMILIDILFNPKKACACKDRAPKGYIEAMNRVQQVYFIENGTFTNSVNPFFGIPTEAGSFKYFSKLDKKIVTQNYEVLVVKSYTQSRNRDLYNYFGAVWAIIPRQKDKLTQSEPTINHILCKASNSNLIPSLESQVKFSNNFKVASCPKGMEVIK
jgi:hypothetical protein